MAPGVLYQVRTHRLLAAGPGMRGADREIGSTLGRLDGWPSGVRPSPSANARRESRNAER
jgi:hypothetical protein